MIIPVLSAGTSSSRLAQRLLSSGSLLCLDLWEAGVVDSHGVQDGLFTACTAGCDRKANVQLTFL